MRPRTHDVLDLTLPVVGDAELETLIEQKTSSLIRQLDTTSDLGSRSSGVRGQIAVQFFEKRRRKAWFTKGEEEVCWEQWTLDVTLAIPRTESGEFLICSLKPDCADYKLERAKVRKAMETMLLKTVMKIVTTVNREKDHIPPITTSEANPFPYQISTNPKGDGWGQRIGIF